MLSALRILVEVATYRLRRLEMANLAGALSVMLALALPWPDVAVRTLFAFLLNLLAYLTNDYCDIARDLATGRAQAKTRYLAEHQRAALGAQLVLGTVLVAIALVWSPGLLAALALGEGLCWLYSARLKRVAYADVVVMAFCGAAMALTAVPLDRPLGLLLVAELGLFSGCFELIQVLRDRAEDAEAGIATTAVKLGPTGTLALLRTLMVLAAIFGSLVLQRWAGALIALAALLPYGSDARKYWNRVRLVFGIAWLGIIGHAVATGHTGGWLAIG
jgi:4-hydroxybenzoate polyprenyltransferase